MKTSRLIRQMLPVLLGLGLIFGFSPGTQAAEAKLVKTEAKKGQKGGATAQSEGELLREAYGILEQADHDYKGHRHAAMHQIAEAARHLGVKLHGDGKAREPQAVSDAQLRHAQSLLQTAHTAVAGHKNAKVPQHIDAAIKELNVALSIK